MNPGDIAPMVAFVTLTVVVGAVALFRPITKRLGNYLEMITRAKLQPESPVEPRIAETLERIEERLRLLEERQEFTDALLRRGELRERLSAADDLATGRGRRPREP